MFPVRFPSMICQWNMSWAEITSQNCLRPSWRAWALRGTPFLHVPFVTEGWAFQPSVRWLPLERNQEGGVTQGGHKNQRDRRQHRAGGPTLLGRIQEVLRVSDAGVNGLQQSHEVLLAPRWTCEWSSSPQVWPLSFSLTKPLTSPSDLSQCPALCQATLHTAPPSLHTLTHLCKYVCLFSLSSHPSQNPSCMPQVLQKNCLHFTPDCCSVSTLGYSAGHQVNPVGKWDRKGLWSPSQSRAFAPPAPLPAALLPCQPSIPRWSLVHTTWP